LGSNGTENRVCLDMGKNPTIFYVLANIRNTIAIATDHVPSIFNTANPQSLA
jgi:hypothetical protein